eukprot:TRINITY_DN2999_c0_g1_i1.p1 TRINITY_DN2999_c0_g1~~TRINITY_DN2999_c0_g1_i1.p1  ORF type:complete len:141 (-),score=19.98 TRINITY_DN2999_c0_g1_i1:313-735(-)
MVLREGQGRVPKPKESHPNPGHYWRFCGASENKPPTPKMPTITPGCACETSWAYKGRDYAGCAAEAPEDEKPWCMVPGPCEKAKPSKFEGGQMWRYCSMAEKERSPPKKPPADSTIKQGPQCECLESWNVERSDFHWLRA